MGRSQFVRGRVRSKAKALGRSPVTRNRSLLERLEPRQLLCGTVLGHDYHLSVWANTTGATSGTSGTAGVAAASDLPALPTTADVSVADTGPNGMPLLHSLAGAPTAIYLDFDGYGTSTAYDTNGNPAIYDATEQAALTEAWRHVASYFSMFYTDVTTVVPTVPYSYSLISNSHTGVGYSYLQFPTTTPSAFNPSGDARSRQSGLAHEIGHNFSLGHQSDYDLLGNKTNEYSSGYDRQHGPIMGVDYAQDVHKWFIGHNSGSPSLLQDDVAVIAGRIDDYSRNDGFRPDDVPNSTAAARALAIDPLTGTGTASGIIERIADADFYSFTSHGGQTRIDVATPAPSMLDAKLEVYASDGTLVAAADSSTTNDQHLTLPTLPAGTYYVAVKSHGGYGDLGPYDLTLRSLATDWAARDIGAVGQPGFASYSADTSSGAPGFSLTGGGADIGGTADEFHLAYTQLTGDGAITARVLSVENTAARALAGVTIRELLAAGSRHATIGLTPTGAAHFRSRSSTSGSTSQAVASGTPAPYWVRLVRTGNAVTGFRSPDGVNWTQLGSMTLASATSAVYVGLATSAANDATTADARFDAVSVEGDAGLVAPVYSAVATPANLRLSQGTGTGLAAQWDAVTGATGYVVERSGDGVTWATAGNVAASATSFSDATLPGSLRYFYRVSATDAGGRSAPSAVVSVVNRPTAVTGLAVTSWTSSQLILNWRDTNGETGYRIERAAEGSDTWTVRANVAANVPSYTDAGLGTDTRWRYRVTPTSPFGDGPAVEALGNTRLPALTGMQVSDKQPNKLTLKWNPVAGATGYRISRSLNGTDYTTLTTVSGTTYDDRAVSPMREYYYRVVGVNGRTESLDGPGDTAFAATPSSLPLPAGWQARDIGAVGGSGATGYAGGTFTVISSGADIWNAADAFRFTYQPLVGNGTITARVATQENTTPFAKAGVMIRENLTPGSRFALTALTPENGTAFQWRTSTSGQAANNNTPPFTAPFWVRLTRVGNRITGYRSADGINWTQQAFADIAMTSSVFVGLAVVPGDNNTLGTVTFSNVSLSNTPPTVASRATASPATISGVSTTLSVLGADDHSEPNLSYLWSVTEKPEGAADPVFSDNGTNAAKSVTATFSAAGTYTFEARIVDTGGLSVTSDVTVEVRQTARGISLTPAGPVTVEPGGQVQFAAALVDQFGRPMDDAAQPKFTWVADAGTIGRDGLYTAPMEEGTYSVFATEEDGGLVGSAEVIVAIRDVTPPTLEGAASYKAHGTGASGGSGALYGIPLALGARSRATVEPRRGGPTMIRLEFSEPVFAVDGLLDSGKFMVENATFVSATLDPTGGAILLNLSDVADRTVVTVMVADLVDGAGNALSGDVDFSVRAVFGDVSGNGVVNELDALQVRRAMFRPLSGETFLYDLDLDGSVNLIDVLHARRSARHDVL